MYVVAISFVCSRHPLLGMLTQPYSPTTTLHSLTQSVTQALLIGQSREVATYIVGAFASWPPTLCHAWELISIVNGITICKLDWIQFKCTTLYYTSRDIVCMHHHRSSSSTRHGSVIIIRLRLSSFFLLLVLCRLIAFFRAGASSSLVLVLVFSVRHSRDRDKCLPCFSYQSISSKSQHPSGSAMIFLIHASWSWHQQ